MVCVPELVAGESDLTACNSGLWIAGWPPGLLSVVRGVQSSGSLGHSGRREIVLGYTGNCEPRKSETGLS